MPEPQGARIPAPRVHPPHATKAMSNQQMIPDGLLDKAVLIHSWLKDRPRAGLSPGSWGNDISAEQWLLGEALPELYERTF